MKTYIKIFFSSIFTAIILLGFAVPVNMVGNWYQQFMPNIGGQQINDIFFIDSLTGFAVSSRNVNPDTASILKTTNGGDNWQIVLTQPQRRFNKVKFVNTNTGFVSGGSGTGTPYLYKTTNAGVNWFVQSSFGCSFWEDMFVLNEDTIWLVDGTSACGGVFRTTNGGSNWQQQVNLGGDNPDKIYMYNARIGFISNLGQLRKTTNGGANWNLLSGTGTGSFSDLYFTDSLTGWKAKQVGGGGWLMGKSTDGGINWVEQILPTGGYISSGSGIIDFVNLGQDTIWGVGGNLFYPGQGSRAFLYRTTNGGNNWYFQIPDTSYQLPNLSFIDFKNSKIGWAYRVSIKGIHTTNGGDTTFYLGIQQTSSNIPKDFELKQNYPNPFNPRTVIPYKLKKSAYVRLIAYEITGKETQIMVDQQQAAGEYEVDFIGKFAGSGVYFYKITVSADKEVYTDTKKMVLIK